MLRVPTLKFKKDTPDAKVPTCAHPGEDLGFDLYAIEDATIAPGEVVKVKTGISCEFPRGFGAIIKERSSMGSKGIAVRAGVIDNGYRGELVVCLHNLNAPREITLEQFTYSFNLHTAPYAVRAITPNYEVKKGDKIAQLVLIPVYTYIKTEEVEELSASERGAGGFGSTGR